MESKALRQLIVAKIAEKQSMFEVLKKEVEDFCIKILVDSKEILAELDTLRTVVFLAIDEVDERTQTGIFDPIDAPVAKGLIDKVFFNTSLGAKAETWFKDIRNKALDIIGKEIIGEK